MNKLDKISRNWTVVWSILAVMVSGFCSWLFFNIIVNEFVKANPEMTREMVTNTIFNCGLIMVLVIVFCLFLIWYSWDSLIE